MSELDRLISASRLRLRLQSPFLATLALFARFIPTQEIQRAGTDGRDIYFNADFWRSLPPAQQDGLLLHALLHAALLHVPRRGSRDAKRWNAAADIVVNGIIATTGDRVELPPDARRNPQLERHSVEEIYELLQQASDSASGPSEPDLLDAPPEAGKLPNDASSDPSPEGSNKVLPGSQRPNAFPDPIGQGDTRQQSSVSVPTDRSPTSVAARNESTGRYRNPVSPPSQISLETYWRNAIEQAKTIAAASYPSELPAGIERELTAIAPHQLDWRRYLWRYLAQTRSDFQGFDRRFVGRGLYLDTLQGESLSAFIAIDTSGSIGDRLLAAFLGEVRGILATYPQIQGQLYYTDSRAYGPYPFSSGTSNRGERGFARPVGGGGTSFIPFFERVAAQANTRNHRQWHRSGPAVCIYLTDGYGTFPAQPPSLPVLWAVAPGGREREGFPFGEVIPIDRTL